MSDAGSFNELVGVLKLPVAGVLPQLSTASEPCRLDATGGSVMIAHTISVRDQEGLESLQRQVGLQLGDPSSPEFPIEIDAFAVRDVVVDPAHPLTIGDGRPVVALFETVTLTTGGKIECKVPVTMHVTTFIKQ